MGRSRIDIANSSGMLRVAIRPKPHWLLILSEVGIISAFAFLLYRNWAAGPLVLRVVPVFVIISSVLDLIYRFSGTQIIEFAPREITVHTEIRGWERKKSYNLEDCSELEWCDGSEDVPSGLMCKVGWKTVTLSKHLTENDAIEILTALQTSTPDVAHKLCSYPGNKEHFITLGLTQQE